MLNSNGGVIAFGIHDNGTVEDLHPLGDKLDHYRKILSDLIKPPCNVYLEEIETASGELIFLYHVEHSNEQCFMRADNEAMYQRVAESNKGPLSRDQVRHLEYNRHTRSFEDELRHDFDSNDLRASVCDYYKGMMKFDRSFEELAVKRNLAKKVDGQIVYKNAAILLFAEDPTQYIPNASVRYVRYEGLERKSGQDYNVTKDERFEECIPRIIELLERFIDARLRDYYYLDMETGRFNKVPEYPKDAWLEGIVNALSHRSYNIQGNAIYIRHYDNRMEISNSGPLPSDVTVENIQNKRFSRNPIMGRVLYEMGYVRELNEGVPRIFSSMSEWTLDEPEYQEREDTIVLTLRNNVTTHRDTIHADVFTKIETSWAELNSSQQQLISSIIQHHAMTVEQLCDYTVVGKQAVRYNLKKLIDMSILERISEKEQSRDKNALFRFIQS